MAERQSYDVVIIGAGPAGLTAGIYTARARLSSLLIEKVGIGGQIANAERVENFPGFVEGISGLELTQLMHQQATKFGVKTITAEAIAIELQEDGKKVVKTEAEEFIARAVIIAGGSKRLTLDIPGEKEFTGKGVSYCATCDAPFFREQTVAVVGGGNAAISEALHLAHFATGVTLIHRRSELRATAIMQERASAEPKITFLWDTAVEKIEGKDFVERLILKNIKTGEKSTLEVAGIFIAIGAKPDTDYLKDILPLDPLGHIITNEKMETEVAGIFAAGDIRHDSARQAITAAGDGATAAIYAQRWLTDQFKS
ncbi:MAG: thioredoxin-disulfide reductase [Dehalococcoidales bacterium]|nr:thioredoxin-disulfide reductase [Dehalococcoidales bacterium]